MNSVGIRVLVLTGLATIHLYGGLCSEWSYSKASACAQRGDWSEARQRISTLLADTPDSPELLYDMSVVAYRSNEFEKAKLYGEHATQCARGNDILKERAFFNVGNTCVALNKLAEAVTAYQAALKIDPQDERAKHNLKKVQEMLEQQKKQQQNNQQGQQGDSDQQTQPKQDDKKNQQSTNPQSKSKDTHQEPQESQSDSSASDEKQNDGVAKGKQGEKNSGLQEGKQQNNDQGSNKNEERDKRNKPNDEPGNEQGDQKQKQEHGTHDSSPLNDKKNQSHHTSGSKKNQAMQEGESMEDIGEMIRANEKKLEQNLAPHERWMVGVLRQREKDDKQANRQVIKAMVDKNLAGKDGQNCW